MRVGEFLKLLGQPGRINYFVICADELGLLTFLQGALATIASTEDIHYYDAEGITKEKARQIEAEARLASRAGSPLQHFFIYSLQKLPGESAGPLLKAVEEAKYARFIFQAQSVPRKIRTLMSRASVVHLPFLSKDVVLANLKAKNLDARTADRLGLWDGTLGGTERALAMKDATVEIRRETRRGLRGLTVLYSKETLGSPAFEPTVLGYLTDPEKAYLRRNPSDARKKIVLYLILQRQG